MEKKTASAIMLTLLFMGILSITVTSVFAVKGKILIDQTHGEYFQPPYQDALTDYVSSLQAAGYVVDILTSGPVTETALTGYDVFLIIIPQVIFSSDEVSAIVSFVSNGGGLYLVGNYKPEYVDPLNSIAINFGVTFNSGNTLGWQTITNIISHTVTLGVGSFHIWAADALDPVTSPSVSLAWASGGETVLAVAEYVLGRVVSFNDATPIHNSHWTERLSEDDIELQMNIIAWLWEAPPLSASINPLSASILVGQSVTFTSTVSGGYTPYSYQWYLNGAPVSGATSNTWTFTPTAGGIYYVHLKVTDAKANTAQSDTARITVATVPVGGYSFPIQVQTKTELVLPYIALIAILTAIFTKLRPKTKRKR